jgi:adenylyltransferase/sulfurtransferase
MRSSVPLPPTPRTLPSPADRPIPVITVTELHARRRRGDDIDLVDVREPHEWEIARIDGARLAPLSSFASAIGSFDGNRDVVVYCKSGGRSAKVVQALQQAGLTRVWNLEGGILRWSEQVDPSVPRY